MRLDIVHLEEKANLPSKKKKICSQRRLMPKALPSHEGDLRPDPREIPTTSTFTELIRRLRHPRTYLGGTNLSRLTNPKLRPALKREDPTAAARME